LLRGEVSSDVEEFKPSSFEHCFQTLRPQDIFNFVLLKYTESDYFSNTETLINQISDEKSQYLKNIGNCEAYWLKNDWFTYSYFNISRSYWLRRKAW